MRGPIAGSALLGVWLAISCGAPVTPAHAGDTASVRVSIEILPIAFLEFPHGTSFTLEVPDSHGGEGHKNTKGKGHQIAPGKGHDKDDQHDYAFIKPVLIPFKVRGNAWAAVSAKPSDFLRVTSGPWLGLATLQGNGDPHKNTKGKGHDKQKGKGHWSDGEDELGYNVIVQYPMPTWLHAVLSGWDTLGQIILNGFSALTGQNGVGTPPLNAKVSQMSNGAYGMIYIVAGNRWTESGKAAKPGYYSGSILLSVTADEY